MVILGRVRSGPDGRGGRGARSRYAASPERHPRPGDGRMSRGAGRGVGRYVGAAAQGAWPSPADRMGLIGPHAGTGGRSSTRGGPDGRPE